MIFHGKSVEVTVEGIVQQLRERGYRVTPQRMAVVEALLDAPSHPTAEDIHRKVVRRFPMVSLATVYKTLHVLRELGIIGDVKVDGRSHFDRDARPHPHLICLRCGQVADSPIDIEAAIPEEALAEQGFRVEGYSLEIFGICRRCQEPAGE